jgi:amidophosphoribosyltransferase
VFDPAGIRPAFYYKDDEVVVIASERPAIQTVFNVDFDDVKELEPGHAIITKKSGEVSIEKILDPLERKACSFERIYFSRGGDAEIYQERKNLGKFLLPKILKAIDNDTRNTVFSFIPNTAETSFYGMTEAVEEHLNKKKTEAILNQEAKLSPEKITEMYPA